MNTALKGRIVRVEASFAGNKKQAGTGLRLRVDWVLTSQHILERRSDKGVVERALGVEVVLAAPGGGEPPRRPAEVRWRGEKDLDPEALRALDAALLHVAGLPEGDGEPISLVPVHLPSGDCETAGWLGVSPLAKALAAPDEFEGRFDAIDQNATILPLRIGGLEPKPADTKAVPYGGISGGPVFVTSGRYKGWLYGLIRKGPSSMPDRLFAVSTPALLRNEGFRRALGISESPPPHENLILATRQLLTALPHLAWRLAQSDEGWRAAWGAEGEVGGVDGLVAALCEGRDLKKLLTAVEALALEAEQDPRVVEDLRRWAGHLTSLLVHGFVAAEGRRIERREQRVVVPMGSTGYAEAALAAERGEAPRYEWRDGTQRPVLQVPDSQIEPGIRAQRRAQDQIEILAECLLREDLATPRYLSPIELDIIESEGDNEHFGNRVVAIRLALEEFCRRQKTSRRPYLLITPNLRRLDLNGTLEAFLVYLATLLPELEQVELRGDAIESLGFENQLKPLWRILGIDKGDG